jgi:hypothetical protein
VLIIEIITHQIVVVLTELLKSIKNVYHVTNKDVKPVVKTNKVLTMLIIVALVKLTESKIHQFVHVTMVIMKKLKLKFVYHVVLNVSLVMITVNVTNVLNQELMLQNVFAHLVCTKLLPLLALLVLHHV